MALLERAVPPGWHVRNQSPITLAESEPEPDVSIVRGDRGDRGDYRNRHPSAADVALVIEVSDTTLAIDRRKARTYAAANIAEYWILDLGNRTVELNRSPDASKRAYADQRVLTETQHIQTTIAGHSIEMAIDDLLP